MKEENPTHLDQLMYKRLGPHLVHSYPNHLHVVIKPSDHDARHKLNALRRKAYPPPSSRTQGPAEQTRRLS